MTSRRLSVALASVAAVALLASGACTTPRQAVPDVPRPTATMPAPESAKALATGAAFLALSGDAGRGFALQLRSSRDGHVLATVFRSAGSTTLAAGAEPDGSVLVAENGECTSTLIRLDLATGRQLAVRTIAEDVSGLVLNPAGTKIAYLAQPTCRTETCHSACAGLAAYPPNVLVVMDLPSGRSTRTSTESPGHPLMGLSWSPDGTQIAAAYWGNTNKVLRFNALAPSFALARPITARPGCEYIATTWTRSGIVSAEGCGSDGLLSPGRLVETTLTGAVRASWPLPQCVGRVILTSTAGRAGALVQTDIGYGNGACSAPSANGYSPLTRIATIDGARLRTVNELHDDLAVSLGGY
jgi:hypothetical protein